MSIIIKAENLTKDFGGNTGIFDLTFQVEKGEMVGFVGTNGSGKSTTIRSLIGFLKPTSGTSFVLGYDSWTESSKFISKIGYVPGEISFPDLKTGTAFLQSQAEFFKLKDLNKANELIKMLQLDPRANLKRMSKGMKQKTALVAALMHDPEILILDEPTTGLDPLMRVNFMDTIKEEHKKGKTILMSSQSFVELEETCDKVIFILNGKIIAIANMDEIKNRNVVDFKIEFNDEESYLKFKEENYKTLRDQPNYYQVTVEVKKENLNNFMKSLSLLDVKFVAEIKYTLESHFKRIAKEEFKEEELYV